MKEEFKLPDTLEGDWADPIQNQVINTDAVTQVLNPVGRYADAVGMTTNMTRNTKELARKAKVVGELLGADGYYSWKQGGKQIEGASVSLANALRSEYRALATSCDIVKDEGNRVHLRARSIDLINGVYEERDFFMNRRPPKGKFAAKPEERERWDTLQMQVAQSKAIRNCIHRILLAWMVHIAVRAAKDAASSQALGNRSLDEVRDSTIKAFAEHHWTREELEDHVSSPVEEWCLDEIIKLRELYTAVKRGEVQAVLTDPEKKGK